MKRDGPNGEAGNLAAGLGGVLLLVSLFLGWYTQPGFTVTAWTAFEVWDVVLAVIAVAVMLSAATYLGWWRGPTHALSPVILASAALLIVASQLINRPPTLLHSGIGSGGWLALVSAGLMVVGALIAESRLTVSFNAATPIAGSMDADASRTSTPPWRRSRPSAAAADPVAGARAPVARAADPVAGAPGPAPVPLGGPPPRVAGRVVGPPGDEDETIATPPPSPRRRPRGA